MAANMLACGMNLILLDETALRDEDMAVLTPAQSRHVREVLRARKGDSLRIGRLNGPLGTGILMDEAHTLLHCDWQATPPRPQLDLLLAMPRPKVMRRLWPVLASLGIGKIWIIQAAKTEKFYFDSHVLSPALIHDTLLEGLAQAQDTWFPEVHIQRRLDVLLQDPALGANQYAVRLLAHPDAGAPDLRTLLPSLPQTGRMLLAIGPEGGWTAREAERLQTHGMTPVSWGHGRTLRTDTACIVLLGILANR